MEDDRVFLVNVENRWKLWILPAIGLAYFAWVLFLALGGYITPGISMEAWVTAGAGLFGLIILLQLPFFIKRKRPKPKRAKGRRAARRGRDDDADAPRILDLAEQAAEPSPPTAGRPPLEHEIRLTKEAHKGLKVIELSHPPKSQNRGGVYAKAFVQVDDSYVLRVEDLVAGPQDR